LMWLPQDAVDVFGCSSIESAFRAASGAPTVDER
jgi:hypothetical protein